MSKVFSCSQITKGKVECAEALVQLDGLYKLMMRDNAPAAIVVQEADTVLVAAVAAMEMPMVHRVDPAFFEEVQTGMKLSLDADNGTITIL